jgi:hypothetical protein
MIPTIIITVIYYILPAIGIVLKVGPLFTGKCIVDGVLGYADQ